MGGLQTFPIYAVPGGERRMVTGSEALEVLTYSVGHHRHAPNGAAEPVHWAASLFSNTRLPKKCERRGLLRW